MKKNIHPKNYRLIIYQDTSSDYSFLTRSCVNTNDTIIWHDGKKYPLFKVEISSKSHPFYTGENKFIDTAGRIDKFMKKYNIKK
ncbi:MAG: type B 50S ribosomal protein L31 [Bacteroides sp.]|nr:MAG: type B 50S ribosomal protein L31 [Bacteroides sp.]